MSSILTPLSHSRLSPPTTRPKEKLFADRATKARALGLAARPPTCRSGAADGCGKSPSIGGRNLLLRTWRCLCSRTRAVSRACRLVRDGEGKEGAFYFDSAERFQLDISFLLHSIPQTPLPPVVYVATTPRPQGPDSLCLSIQMYIAPRRVGREAGCVPTVHCPGAQGHRGKACGCVWGGGARIPNRSFDCDRLLQILSPDHPAFFIPPKKQRLSLTAGDAYHGTRTLALDRQAKKPLKFPTRELGVDGLSSYVFFPSALLFRCTLNTAHVAMSV